MATGSFVCATGGSSRNRRRRRYETRTGGEAHARRSCQLGLAGDEDFRGARIRPLPAGLAPAISTAAATAVIPTTFELSTAAAITASSGAGAEFRLRTRLVDDEGSTLHLKLVKFANRPLSLLVRRHLHEGKTPGSTGCHIAHDSNALHRTGAAEQSVQLLIGGAVGKVANVEPTTHLLWFPGSVRGLHSNGFHPRARVIRSSGRLLVPARAGRLIPAQHNAGLPLLRTAGRLYQKSPRVNLRETL